MSKRLYCKRSDQSSMAAPVERDAMSKALALPEILQMIFCKLDIESKGRAAQVSRLWTEVIKHPRVWRNTMVGLIYDETEPFQYSIIPVGRINQSSCIQIVSHHSCQTFDFINYLVVCKVSTDKTISLIVGQFRNIVTLWLSGKRATKVTDFALILIADGLTNLRHLSLWDFSGITDIGVAVLCGSNGVTYNANVPHLYSLTLNNCKDITDEALKHLSIGQTSLRSLILSYCERITNNGLQYLTRLVDLHILSIFWRRNNGDAGMVHLAQMVNLLDLHLGCSITTAGLEQLTSGNLRLTNLRIENCRGVDDTCGKALARLTHLRELRLSGTNIGDSVLKCLADGAGAASIDTLGLSQCHNLTPQAGQHLARMINLRVVDLSGTSFDDVGIGYLAAADDSKIEILWILRCKCITKAGFAQARRLPRLQKLRPVRF